MVEIITWPSTLLVPEECRPNLVPYTRSGGRSLGGVEPVVRTDLGFWSIDLSNIAVYSRDQRQTWIAIRQKLGGRAGLIAVPAWSFDTAPYLSGEYEPPATTTHSDNTPFDDDTPYVQGAIAVVTVGNTPMGATTIRMKGIQAAEDFVGVRFSYNHALYEAGPVTDVTDEVWTVSISPTVREIIPAGASLEFDMPTCLCHLSEDRGMDGGLNNIAFEQRSVSFTEATDYWNKLALGLI
ncbi:hypothetical protein [Agrobacterium tumefaciens]|uniref:hypothetical protein n=1 Tax=Agrobacterium tumefaciens TaxID=358 RepID=UPI001CC12BDD|nr:hypothetical protein [Agrobacterium tumefaciens]